MLQVVTDSSCDLPEELIKAYKIRVIPLTISIEDRTYLERVEITPEAFYEQMAENSNLPKTSQPAPAAFAASFRELAESGQVICLTISSKLSGTYQSACLGKDLAGVNASVFDTLAGSLGHGLQVLRACKLAQAGCTASEVMAELAEYRKRMKILILLNTLENIVKGGRLSKFQGALASILNIKLLLHNVDGAVELLERVRGSKKFLRRVMETVQEFCPDMSERDVGITDFLNPAGSEQIQRAMREQNPPRSIITNSMGATMATYAGHGGMIVSF